MQPKSAIGKQVAAIAKSVERQSQKAGAAAGKQVDKAKAGASRKVAAAKKGWKKMDPKTKKKVVIGGIAALAAAIAIPLAIKRARKKK
jgi:hypothetical protein